MKIGFYPRLAWEGIRKNKRLYLPYILTCAGMITMLYIISYLASMQELKDMPGGRTTNQILGFGIWIVAFFAVIFLFYTNSFLMRRRKKEFGLYNILGMGKPNLSLLLFWETIIIFAVAMFFGLLGGILLAKLAELLLIMIINGEVLYKLTINFNALTNTVLIFIPIFGVIFVKNLFQLGRLSAVALLKSENTGEKPPKANYILGIAGVLILAIAYYIAVSINSPLIALFWFFVAVIMVIIATYLLFISGSVLLCKILQKNKKYYYKKNHFVSVSSMVYRMKRNGAGLASICILSTMVLVIMMGAGSLYFGKEDSLNTRYPHDITIIADYYQNDAKNEYTEEKKNDFFNQIDDVLNQYDFEPQNAEFYLSTTVTGILKDGKLNIDNNSVNVIDKDTMDYVSQIYIIPLSSYNECMGTQETLADDEVFIHCMRRTYNGETIELNDGTTWKVKKQVENMVGNGDAAMQIIPAVFIVVSDIESVLTTLNTQLTTLSPEYLCDMELTYSFDTNLPSEEQLKLGNALKEHLRKFDIFNTESHRNIIVECRDEERADFYGMYGGLFFLGIILSIVFLAATVLIIYYKQISEGYEDEARFDIMRKVGMTTKDIRKSINSQMLTVFFLPLITAALHVGFAFPLVQKLLAMFNLTNTTLSLTVTGIAIVIFGIFYAIVYRLTSNAYYSIVIGNHNNT